MSTPITTYVQDALKRLLYQYQGKPNLVALITALVTPVQELEDMFNDLNQQTMLAVATGVTLDNIGTIVGLTRVPGDSDAAYRVKLYAQIKINTSDGQPEQIIQIFQILTGVSPVLLFEFFPAEVMLESSYVPPDQPTVDSFIAILDEILPVGVRPYGIVAFDPADAFAYDGTIPGGAGYGSASDATVGGKYPTLFLKDGQFAYGSTNPLLVDATGIGYGSKVDPLVGGEYAS